MNALQGAGVQPGPLDWLLKLLAAYKQPTREQCIEWYWQLGFNAALLTQQLPPRPRPPPKIWRLYELERIAPALISSLGVPEAVAFAVAAVHWLFSLSVKMPVGSRTMQLLSHAAYDVVHGLPRGASPSFAASAARELVALAELALVDGSVHPAGLMLLAIDDALNNDASPRIFLAAGAAGAARVVVALVARVCASESARTWAALGAARALVRLSSSASGAAALLEAAAAPALAALALGAAAAGDPVLAEHVARVVDALGATGAAGKSALLAAGVAPALVALAGEAAVAGAHGAAEWVARAIARLSAYPEGAAALLAAGAAPALVALAGGLAVAARSVGAARQVARAMARLGVCPASKVALLAAGATRALVELGGYADVRADAAAVLWIHRALSGIDEAAVTATAKVGQAPPPPPHPHPHPHPPALPLRPHQPRLTAHPVPLFPSQPAAADARAGRGRGHAHDRYRGAHFLQR